LTKKIKKKNKNATENETSIYFNKYRYICL
jgi:hypothetical protein